MRRTRFRVIEGSRSGHCCFDWSVVDTHEPTMFGPDHYRDQRTGEVQYKMICECFQKEHADTIANALNVALPGG